MQIDDLQPWFEGVQQSIESVDNLSALDDIRIQTLGRKGQITTLMQSLKEVDASERPAIGQKINEIKQRLQGLLGDKKLELEALQLQHNLSSEKIDISLPGRHTELGRLHPITRTLTRIETLFARAGFEMVEGPEIENDWYNFEALNFPANHPARAMHDTFYFGDGRLLRTHTSSVQIRTLENRQPPIRIIAPGRVFRCDSDQTHTPMFHQVEGLVVDTKANFSQLIGVLTEFLKSFFEDDALQVRFRPSFFPFTEPSSEADIKTKLFGDGKWMEILGCGMVHPAVLENVNLDPEIYTGYAFGLGVERLAMLRYGVNDLRMFFENDIRLLKQF